MGNKIPKADRSSQARSKKTRTKILDSALGLLAQNGPGAVTHRAVAQDAGVSLGATTYHFKSKYDLLQEVYRLHLAQVRKRAEQLGDPSSGSQTRDGGEARKRKLAHGLMQYLTIGVFAHRTDSLASFELSLEMARDPELRRRLRSSQRASEFFAAESIRDLGSKQPDVDSLLLIAALNGLRLAWLAEGPRSKFGKAIPAVTKRLAEIFIRTWERDHRG